MTPEMLGAIGGICVLALGINAYFIKSLVNAISEVKDYTAKVDKNLAVMITDSKHLDKRLENAEDRIRNLEKSDSLIREALHGFRSEVHGELGLLKIKQRSD